jgi:nitrate reductase delta subunit
MVLFNRRPPTELRGTLRVLSALLSYPDTEHRGWLASMEPLAAEADYVQLFDGGRATSLHLFEHVHGDSRDRGPAMLDLAQSYSQQGLELTEGELPDFLPAVLEFASTLPASKAREFLGETTHLLQSIFSALLKRESGYASVLAALLEISGGTAEAVSFVEDPPIDETWEEPEVFGGCSTAGQSRPGSAQTIAQPIQFIQKPASSGARP